MSDQNNTALPAAPIRPRSVHGFRWEVEELKFEASRLNRILRSGLLPADESAIANLQLADCLEVLAEVSL